MRAASVHFFAFFRPFDKWFHSVESLRNITVFAGFIAARRVGSRRARIGNIQRFGCSFIAGRAEANVHGAEPAW
jgi:hypothetical protein